LNPSAGSTNFGGVMSDAGAANAISLVKSGSGTQVLSGVNTYSGGTTVNGGSLALAGSGTLGTSGKALRVSNGASLDLGTTTQVVGQVNAPGVGNGVFGNITNGTLNLNASTMYIQNGTITANLS